MKYLLTWCLVRNTGPQHLTAFYPVRQYESLFEARDAAEELEGNLPGCIRELFTPRPEDKQFAAILSFNDKGEWECSVPTCFCKNCRANRQIQNDLLLQLFGDNESPEEE